ncbi:uncharacterized protein LOC131326774 [Rhododendron vialii]|uniref:uncharacterized protein LOC131326774 n=1 Tax=Rhododendron vialii TaxID=182163 RepID=UPI00265FDF33|nr:uncharacterized protein LOC131326774 [Rhododendron vialii]
MAQRIWTEVEEETLLSKLTTLVDQGMWNGKPSECQPAYLEYLQNQMQASFPEAGIEPNHILRKMKYWKRGFFYVTEILHRPGFGWDSNENKVVAEYEVWEELIRDRPQVRLYRDRQIPKFNRLGHIFGRREN